MVKMIVNTYEDGQKSTEVWEYDDGELFRYLIKGIQCQSSMILDNLGITACLSELPEFKAYVDYVHNPNFFVRAFREIFKRKRIAELRALEQAAFINAVMGQAERRFL